MSLALLFHYLMLNMFRMLIHPSSGVCDLFVELFHELYCSGSMCVGVTLWFGWGGVVSGCRLQPVLEYRVSLWDNVHQRTNCMVLFELPFTLEEGTDRLSRNVGKYQYTLRKIPEEISFKPRQKPKYQSTFMLFFILQTLP